MSKQSKRLLSFFLVAFLLFTSAVPVMAHDVLDNGENVSADEGTDDLGVISDDEDIYSKVPALDEIEEEEPDLLADKRLNVESGGEIVSYTIIYWAEKIDNTETPYKDQNKARGYDYLGSQQSEGVSGQPAEVPADSDSVVASFNPLLKDHIALNQDKTESANAGQTINEDGSTTVHVYYDRNVYSILMSNRGQNGQVWSWIYNGVEYDDQSNPYIITAKYGDYIAAEWPASGPTPTSGQFYGWTTPYGFTTTIISTKRLNMINELAYGTENDPAVLTPLSVTNGSVVNVQYWLQGIDTYEYFEEETLTQDIVVASGSAMAAKEIQGFTNRWELDEQTSTWIRFYYDRNNYTLVLNDGEENVQSYEVPYKKELAEYNNVPEAPEKYAGYQFAGWYTTPNYYEDSRFDIDSTVMEANNLVLFAKWEK